MSATPEQIADERADWLLDAIAGATQDRQFLRGDAECNPVICEAVLLNGAKAIRTAIARAQEERVSAAPEPIAADLDRWVTYMNVGRERDAYQPEGVRLLTQAAALIRAQSEREKVLVALLDEARPLLACENCENGPHVINTYGEPDECPACQGEHRNSSLVKAIDAALAGAR